MTQRATVFLCLKTVTQTRKVAGIKQEGVEEWRDSCKDAQLQFVYTLSKCMQCYWLTTACVSTGKLMTEYEKNSKLI